MLGKTTDDKYIAFGLSDSMSMADASVMFCYNAPDLPKPTGVGMSWNNDKYHSVVLDDATHGLSEISSYHIDGVLTCSYTRDENTTIKVPGSSNSSMTNFDLKNGYYVMIAVGPIKQNLDRKNIALESFPIALTYHSAKVVSQQRVTLNVSSHITAEEHFTQPSEHLKHLDSSVARQLTHTLFPSFVPGELLVVPLSP